MAKEGMVAKPMHCGFLSLNAKWYKAEAVSTEALQVPSSLLQADTAAISSMCSVLSFDFSQYCKTPLESLYRHIS